MISGEALFSNILTVSILLGLFIIIYAKMTKKTLVDIIRDLKDAFSDKTEEVVDFVPHSFESIR